MRSAAWSAALGTGALLALRRGDGAKFVQMLAHHAATTVLAALALQSERNDIAEMCHARCAPLRLS